MNLAFRVTKDKLHNSLMPVLYLENGIYEIVAVYMDDYGKDRREGSLSKQKVSIQCRPKDPYAVPKIVYDREQDVYVLDRSGMSNIIWPDRLDEYVESIYTAYGCIGLLDAELSKYFGPGS